VFFDTIFRKRSNRPEPKTDQPDHETQTARTISTTDFPTGKLADSLSILRRELGSSPDIVIRNFQTEFQRDAAIVFLNGLVAKERIETGILTPLITRTGTDAVLPLPKDLGAYIQARLTCGQINRATGLNTVLEAILSGDTALLADGLPDAFLINTKGGEFRAIQEPAREFTVKGSREGFVEALDTNIAILRRKIKSPQLRFDPIHLGKTAQTNICIAYLQGIASPDLIGEINRRLKAIQIDAILDSGQIEELIRDSPGSPFTTLAYSERPDVVAAKIAEGRAALLIDGTPVVLTVPTLLMERFQNPDDYNFNFLYATLIRWIRFTGLLLTVFSPALYVALISYHPELIPTPLLIKMAGAAEGTPFPAVIEAIGMGVIVELLREAGRWMPGATGTVITVLGLLVVGQALFNSGLVAPPFVLVVTITLLASFLVPTQENVNPFLRLFLVVLSGCLGLYGLMLGLIIVYIHLAGLRSFGVPYLAPLTPWNPHDAQDILIRAPWWRLRRRPTLISREDRIRQDNSSRPES
jgi:spore germination protein KA